MQLSFGIYKKQLLFFLGLFLVAGGIFYFVTRQESQASVRDLAVSEGTGTYVIDVNISENGEVNINNKNYNKLLSIGKDFDELRFVAADSEGNYIQDLVVAVHLPKPVTASEIKQYVYAVHGVGDKEFHLSDEGTLYYRATNLSPSATFTIVAEFPKGYFKFSGTRLFINNFYSASPLVWLIVSMIFPIITLVVLFFMFRQSLKDRFSKLPKETRNTVPSNLSPAEAGVLVDGAVSSRSIASTLLDLAERNVIIIASHSDGYSFGKRKLVDFENNKNDNLRLFERILLSKIFTKEEIKSSIEDVQVRIGRHVFSRKVAEVYLNIYEGISAGGYFIENPSKMHTRYKKTGYLFFLLGIIGFIIGVFWAPDPKYYLLFWTAMIFTSFIIIRLSLQLPLRTGKGQTEVNEWLKFRNYLSSASPMNYQDGNQKVFEKYLPYAIALKCETEWANRFMEHPFQIPEWFCSDKQIVTIEDFVQDLYPVIGFISQELAASKEPIV